MDRDWELLVICLAAILAAPLLEVRQDDRVHLRGWPRLVVPPLCSSRELLGVPCPGCGLTRSIVHLAHGRWDASYRSHRLGWLVALIMLLQIPYRAATLRRGKALFPARFLTAFSNLLIAALLVNWLVEIVV